MMLSPTKDQLLKFYVSMTKGEVEQVDAFLNEYPDVIHQRFNSRPLVENNHQEMHPHHVAVIHNQPEVLRVLLRRNPDLESHDITGRTALHFAAETGGRRTIAVSLLEMMDMLLKAGADVNARARGSKLTPLFCASNPFWHDAALLLLNNGADPLLENVHGLSPWSWLCRTDNTTAFGKALNAAALKSVSRKVDKGTTEKVAVIPKIKLRK